MCKGPARRPLAGAAGAGRAGSSVRGEGVRTGVRTGIRMGYRKRLGHCLVLGALLVLQQCRF